jgi:hypothetical protein
VIANLAAYFALHTLFTATVDYNGGPVHLEMPVLASSA